jgi:hypothetical protein
MVDNIGLMEGIATYGFTQQTVPLSQQQSDPVAAHPTNLSRISTRIDQLNEVE